MKKYEHKKHELASKASHKKGMAKVHIGAKHEDIGHVITDHKGRVLERHEGKGRFALK